MFGDTPFRSGPDWLLEARFPLLLNGIVEQSNTQIGATSKTTSKVVCACRIGTARTYVYVCVRRNLNALCSKAGQLVLQRIIFHASDFLIGGRNPRGTIYILMPEC